MFDLWQPIVNLWQVFLLTPRSGCSPMSGAACAATIKNFTRAVKADDLPLVGTCSECRGDVAGVVEVG